MWNVILYTYIKGVHIKQMILLLLTIIVGTYGQANGQANGQAKLLVTGSLKRSTLMGIYTKTGVNDGKPYYSGPLSNILYWHKGNEWYIGNTLGSTVFSTVFIKFSGDPDLLQQHTTYKVRTYYGGWYDENLNFTLVSPCSVDDGSAANSASCACGTSGCAPGLFCYKDGNQCSTNVIPVCLNTDGSSANSKSCACGTSECAPPGSYTERTEGKCKYPITTLTECELASVALGWADTIAVDDGQTGKSFDPLGCYYEGGSLKLNNIGNTGSCTVVDKCACKAVPFCTAATSTCSQYAACSNTDGSSANSKSCACGTYDCCDNGQCPVYQRTEGKCKNPITTLLECELASVALGWGDTSAVDDGQTGDSPGDSLDPLGCYYEGGSLKLNNNGNYGLCSSYDICACKPEPGLFCTASNTCSQYEACSNTDGSVDNSEACACGTSDCIKSADGVGKVYTEQLQGTCANPITTLAECELAAAAVGWADTSAVVQGQTGFEGNYPSGCFFYNGHLKFNNGGNTGSCSWLSRCACSSGGTDGSGYCTASSDRCATVPSCDGTDQAGCACGTRQCTKYTLRKDGYKCEHPITTLTECEQAAEFLGWADTSAIDDGQNGVANDPLGCYYKVVSPGVKSLKLNVNGNTGYCNPGGLCACKSTGMFCVDGTCSQYKDNTAYHHGAGLAGLVQMGAADLKKVYNNLETC